MNPEEIGALDALGLLVVVDNGRATPTIPSRC